MWTVWIGEVIHVMIINTELDIEEKILSAIKGPKIQTTYSLSVSVNYHLYNSNVILSFMEYVRKF